MITIGVGQTLLAELENRIEDFHGFFLLDEEEIFTLDVKIREFTAVNPVSVNNDKAFAGLAENSF